MGLDGKIGWFACLPLFIAGIIFAVISVFRKEEKTEKSNLIEKRILEEWDKIEEENNRDTEQ